MSLSDYEPLDVPEVVLRETPSSRGLLLNKQVAILISNEHHDFFRRGVDVPCLHVSMSCRDRYPTWEEIKQIRYDLMHKDKDAFMVLPPLEDYVNVHPNCFHLWMPL